MSLLAVDVGNTNITFGLFQGRRLVRTWRCETGKMPARRRCGGGAGWFDGKMVRKPDGIIVSSVVPEIDGAIKKILKKKFGITPVFVTHKNAGVKIGYPRSREIGADRLVDAVATWQKYRVACIVVDFGTATTLEYIDKKGVYWGGPIAPGLKTANKILYDAASKLPLVKIIKTKKMIPTTTAGAIQSGLYHGYIGMIEHLIKKTVKEVGGRPRIIATGGFAPLIAKGMSITNQHEPNLTLEGLRIIWSRLNS